MSDRSLSHLSTYMEVRANEHQLQFNAWGALQNPECKLIFTETFRSAADQDADYAKGRTEPGSIITNAQAGQSAHNCMSPDGSPAAEAYDIGIEIYPEGADGPVTLDWDGSDARWLMAIQIGESLGLVSGSGKVETPGGLTWTNCHLVDTPHFEKKGWDDGKSS